MKAVVFVASGWNASWLGCYGNEWLETPHLDRLAAESVVFDQHLAINPSPDEWRHSLASGCFEFAASHQRPSLFDCLRTQGVSTIRIRDVRDRRPDGVWSTAIDTIREDEAAPGEALLTVIAQQLADLASRDQWLLWIETDRLLPPWSVALDYFDRYIDSISRDEGEEIPTPWDEPPLGKIETSDRDIERLQATFAAVVTEWDADLGRCFDLLRKHDLWETTACFITSGHGLALAEHDWIGPEGGRLHEELVHVPLLLHLPNGEQGGRRVLGQTASVDLLPTLLEWFQVPLPGISHGRSLLPLARGKAWTTRSYSCQGLVNGQRALRTPDWTLLSPYLFRKPEDRYEMSDQRVQHLDWAEHLEKTLDQFIAAAGREPFAPPPLPDYDEVSETREEKEATDEHGTTGGRNDRSAPGEGDLRRHQGDEED